MPAVTVDLHTIESALQKASQQEQPASGRRGSGCVNDVQVLIPRAGVNEFLRSHKEESPTPFPKLGPGKERGRGEALV
jgi:hypothetical protein